ncbi:hypothetical protein Ate02nite_72570 [Paractinoplanes tereljensis]|uniref:Uncharacterized protein n=1 Tax=Paractinoplanes tereljensis TaxID=571912 RepID=A0A919NVK4_9ACTN|nr:hypothetical protein Ate02nite_72570 [Actinoplanes tereljensis]
MSRPVRVADDWYVGSLLRGLALLEIRAMARRKKPMEWWAGDDYVACIAWLADLCHNMPDARTRIPGFGGLFRRVRRRERPFAHAWRVADQAGREWILGRLAREGVTWTPPA